MKKFKVGKTYKGEGFGFEIKILKRTEKTVTFIYTGKNWFEQNIEKEYKKKIRKSHPEFESIDFGNHWSSPSIYAI